MPEPPLKKSLLRTPPKLVSTKMPRLKKLKKNSLAHSNDFMNSRSGSGLAGLLGSLASSDFQCKPLQSGKFEGFSFNGLGGHGKAEENIKRLPNLKPKGVSRPLSARYE